MRNNMAQNGSVPKELTSKQAKYVDAILIGSSVLVAAQESGISARTAARWKQDQRIQQELLLRRKQQFNEALDDFRDGLPEAMAFVRDIIKNEDAPYSIRLRAAQIWIENALQIHGMQELANRIAMLEERYGGNR